MVEGLGISRFCARLEVVPHGHEVEPVEPHKLYESADEDREFNPLKHVCRQLHDETRGFTQYTKVQ